MLFYHILFVLLLGRLHFSFPDPQRLKSTAGAAGCYSRVWVGPLLTRVPWGLLLGTAWASNSCDKRSSHGDRGHFSQTNNGRMFICGSSHFGRSACLPLSPDRRIGVYVLDCLAQLFLSFSYESVCFLSCLLFYFCDFLVYIVV